MASLDEVSVAIGALTSDTRTLTVETKKLVDKAETHGLETKMIRLQLEDLVRDLSSVKKDVEEFKPIARKVRNWEQRALGVSLVAGFSGGGALAWLKGVFG